MKAMILAAGLGTRLKPWTLEHPKALIPVCGVPMLKRVIDKLTDSGFDEIVINIHHFGNQIVDYISENQFDAKIGISDEREKLLDTGGGIKQAYPLICKGSDDSMLVHNVDILSNADLKRFFQYHIASGNDITLLTSNRVSSRKLIFGDDERLKGWHNCKSGEYKPGNFVPSATDSEEAFSGIYVIGAKGYKALANYAGDKTSFPIMDFLLANMSDIRIGRLYDPSLDLIDIGKPEMLRKAQENLRE